MAWSPASASRFAELPREKKTFTNITLKGPTIYFPGKITWDGKYVTVADQQYGGRYSGTTGIYQSTIIGPDYQDGPENEVLFYKYPAGGNATKAIKGHGLYQPIGAAISAAQ